MRVQRSEDREPKQFQNKEEWGERITREPERVAYHEIIWIDSHEPSQDFLRPHPISLSGRHKRSVHVHEIFVSLRDISRTSTDPLALVSAPHRHLRSDPTEIWRGARGRDRRCRWRGGARDRFRCKIELCKSLVEEPSLEVYPPHC